MSARATESKVGRGRAPLTREFGRFWRSERGVGTAQGRARRLRLACALITITFEASPQPKVSNSRRVSARPLRAYNPAM